MRKLIKRLGITVLAALLIFKVPIPSSWADLTATPGSGATIAYKLIGAANTAIILLCDATAGETTCATITGANAVKVDNSAVTQPISAAALPLPAGAATAALQATNTATTVHTCAVAGYSELGCLGQVDDDIKGPVAVGPNRIGFVSLQADTTGGCGGGALATTGGFLTAASNNATLLKSGAGTLCSWDFENTTTSTFDIRFYDTATAPAAGVPCNSATNLIAGNHVAQSNAVSPGMQIFPGNAYGFVFTSGLVVCVTGANANNDNTNAVVGGNFNFALK